MGQRRKLTRQEKKVFTRIAEGYSYEQIAGELHISPRTTEQHVRNVLTRFGVSRAVQALVIAIKDGLIDLANIRIPPDCADGEYSLE